MKNLCEHTQDFRCGSSIPHVQKECAFFEEHARHCRHYVNGNCVGLKACLDANGEAKVKRLVQSARKYLAKPETDIEAEGAFLEFQTALKAFEGEYE